MNQPAQASAFRARRFEAWKLRRLGSRYGELPRFALPGAAPATDSAAAPRPTGPARPPRASAPPRPDPEYERKLEQLAQTMLGPAASDFTAEPGAKLGTDAEFGAKLDARLGAQLGADLAADGAAGCAADGAASVDPRVAAARERIESTASAPRRTPQVAPSPSRGPLNSAMRQRLADVDSRGRREPVLEPLLADANPDPFLQHRSRRRRRRMIAGSLAASLTLGLACAWWFGESHRIDSALTAVNDNALALLANLDRQRAGDRSSAASAAKDQSAALAAPPAATATELQDRPDPVPVVVTPAPATQGAAPAAASAQSATATADPAPQSVSQPPVASVDASKKKEKSRHKSREPSARAEKRKQAQIASAKSSKKLSPAATPENRDDDLDRLRSQAYSESSRDREQRVRPKPASPPAPLAVTPISTGAESRISHKKELAQCEKLDGLLWRERCKWRICDDQWGKNGCPSFPQQTVRF